MGDKTRIILMGRSAAGKTTLAALLCQIYPDCSVFHMDDFFLRPEQRTPERLAAPGGNVDYERFSREVLTPLHRGETVQYRPYNCHTQTMGDLTEAAPRTLNIVEGAYSMHPALAGCYDLCAFCRSHRKCKKSVSGTGITQRRRRGFSIPGFPWSRPISPPQTRPAAAVLFWRWTDETCGH